MVTKEQIISLINAHLQRALLFAEAAIQENQFKAFRKLILDEFGKSGLVKELDRLFEDNSHKDR